MGKYSHLVKEKEVVETVYNSDGDIIIGNNLIDVLNESFFEELGQPIKKEDRKTLWDFVRFHCDDNGWTEESLKDYFFGEEWNVDSLDENSDTLKNDVSYIGYRVAIDQLSGFIVTGLQDFIEELGYEISPDMDPEDWDSTFLTKGDESLTVNEVIYDDFLRGFNTVDRDTIYDQLVSEDLYEFKQ